MKKLLLTIIALLSVTLLIGCGENETVVIYTTLEDFRMEALNQQLSIKYPDINVRVDHYPTGTLASKLKNEGEATEADIVYLFELSYMEMVKDLFVTLDDQKFTIFEEPLVPEHKKYIPVNKYSAAVIVNTTKITNLPETYEDLLKPEYKNQIIMPNPKSSATGYQFLLLMVNLLGEEEAFDYFDRLSENVKQFTPSGSAPLNSIIMGDGGIAIGMTFHAVKKMNEGAPLVLMNDSRGVPYNLEGAGIIKGKENKEKVQTIFKYLSEEFVYFDKQFAPENIFKVPYDSNFPNWPNLTYATMDGITNNERKMELLEKWNHQ